MLVEEVLYVQIVIHSFLSRRIEEDNAACKGGNLAIHNYNLNKYNIKGLFKKY